MALPFIMVAPSGARRSKADHAALPISVAEIVDTARDCHAAGAAGIHLHIRDAAGVHSLDGGRYREAVSELRSAVPEMRVQISTETVGLFSVAQQLGCLEQVQPAWASISIREISSAPDLADRVYGSCFENATEVQHILYDTKDVALLQDWQSKGIVRPSQNSVIYVLGRYAAGMASTPDDLLPFLDAHVDRGNWMVCAFGPQEHNCLASAAALGGDLRVGFENSLTNSSGQVHENNAASVASLIDQLQGISE